MIGNNICVKLMIWLAELFYFWITADVFGFCCFERWFLHSNCIDLCREQFIKNIIIISSSRSAIGVINQATKRSAITSEIDRADWRRWLCRLSSIKVMPCCPIVHLKKFKYSKINILKSRNQQSQSRVINNRHLYISV